MRTARAAAAALALLAALAAAAPARSPSVAWTSLPGTAQPDPGTDPAPSRNGRVVAFAASLRESGEAYLPDATPTVFAWDRRLGTLRQVTAAGPSDQPSAENGTFHAEIGTATEKTTFSRTLVAFRSTANLAGRNADGSAEIFVWDSGTGAFTQVSEASAGASSDPSLGAEFRATRDANGKYTGQITVRWRVAFLSTSDLAGDNAAGLPQVFLYDSGLPEVGRLVQVSHSATGAAGPPAADGNGNRIGFLHDGGLLDGDVPGDPVAYLHDVRRGLRRAARHRAGEPGADGLCIDGTGRFLAWSLPAPMQLILVDSRSGWTRALAGTGNHRAPSLGRGRRLVAFLSDDALGDPAPPSSERPALWRPGGGAGPLADGGPAHGAPRLVGRSARFFLASEGNLDGSNAEGGTVLFEGEVVR
jgi:hypothetical protein